MPQKQGKISTAVVIKELTKEKPLPKYKIAKLAGSNATTKDNLTNALNRKVQSSTEIQNALKKHQVEVLEAQCKVNKELAQKITKNKDINKLSPNERLNHFVRTAKAVSQLSCKENNELHIHDKAQINIYANKTDEELMEILNQKIVEGEISKN